MTDASNRKGRDPSQLVSSDATATSPKKAVADSAFDSWLRGKLHAIFDGVAQEPLPDELMRLIAQDRERDGKK